MHWSGYVFIAGAFLAAHLGGSAAGKFARKKSWSYGTTYSVLVIALGVPYVLAVVAWLNAFPTSRVGQFLAIGIFPTLIYARWRLKSVLFPDLKWHQEPPRGS